MYALTRPYPRKRTALLDGTPLPVLTMLVALVIAAWVLAITGMGSPRIARAVSAGAAQGALLACAVAWTVVRPAATADLLPAGIALTVLAGAIAAALTPAGAVVYLLAPLWLWRRRERLPAFGLDAAPPPSLVLGGVVLGATLGIHLMITASLTLGYRIVRPVAADLGPWLAYDAGANVLAAECFFRGALFNRAQRRWSFAAATALCTAACVGRYLIDPLLPRTLEMAAGAAFYVALLSVGNCWLYWRSGSVVPGLVAGFVFFAVYRLLHGVR